MSNVRSGVSTPSGVPVAMTRSFDVPFTTTLALATLSVHAQVISGRYRSFVTWVVHGAVVAAAGCATPEASRARRIVSGASLRMLLLSAAG